MRMSEQTGLVLEGGGMRAIYTAGVLDVFMEHGIQFDGVIGISAGSIHGSNFVAEQKGRTIRYYKKYCTDPRMIGIRSLLLTGNIVNTKFFYEKLPTELDPFDFETFSKSETAFYAGATNVETGQAEYIQIQDMRSDMDALRASASLPYVSRIVEYKGKKLLDGAFSDSIPINAFRKMGYGKNVVVLTQHEGYVKQPENVKRAQKKYKKYPAFVAAVEQRHKVYNQTLEDIQQYRQDGSVFAIYPSQPIELSLLVKDPEDLQKIYDLGAADAKERIEDLKAWMQS